MIEQWLQVMSRIVTERVWLAPILALLAGVLTSILPCSLSAIPLVIGYVGGVGTEPKKAFRLSIVFAVGTAITFTILGTLAALAGNLIGATSSWWYGVLGALMILMALQTWEIFQFIPATYLMTKNTKTGYIGALAAGVLGGIFSSPCATPMLVALLAIVAGKGSVLWGMLLLLLYAIGHSFLTIVAGTSIGFVHALNRSETYGKLSKWVNGFLGTVMLLIGFYMFYLAF